MGSVFYALPPSSRLISTCKTTSVDQNTNNLPGAFSVDRVHEVEWTETILDSLVMHQSLNGTIFRLIKTHSTRSSGFDDFVKGKGKGLVGLLLGPPGSCKTLTAEAIAETAHMPLYMISSGALG